MIEQKIQWHKSEDQLPTLQSNVLVIFLVSYRLHCARYEDSGSSGYPVFVVGTDEYVPTSVGWWAYIPLPPEIEEMKKADAKKRLKTERVYLQNQIQELNKHLQEIATREAAIRD